MDVDRFAVVDIVDRDDIRAVIDNAAEMADPPTLEDPICFVSCQLRDHAHPPTSGPFFRPFLPTAAQDSSGACRSRTISTEHLACEATACETEPRRNRCQPR